jgi:hypothetical protein
MLDTTAHTHPCDAEMENSAGQVLNTTVNVTVRGCRPGEVTNAAKDECNVCM